MQRPEKPSNVLCVARAQDDVCAVPAQYAPCELGGKISLFETAAKHAPFKAGKKFLRRVERRDAAFLQDRDAPAERRPLPHTAVFPCIISHFLQINKSVLCCGRK